jgi:GNAT superfamily N-acetyltransferase
MTHAAGWTIRPARAADAWALAELRYEFRSSLDPASETRERFVPRCSAWMADRLAHPDWLAWIAEPASVPRGMAWLHLIDKLPNPVTERECHGYITSLYVQPAGRNAGVGTRLLAECLRACETRGCDAVILWPSPKSRSLYLRHGFAVRNDLFECRLAPPPDHRGIP